MISTETKPSPTTAREGQVDIREDEDQSVKLSEIVELLLAAGYFRARIKGLSPFDKVGTNHHNSYQLVITNFTINTRHCLNSSYLHSIVT
ncbi:Coiled-coil domain-containing protein 93 [Portunus trituberculatus]|uniref:Coiled-coil domain-containing protein 93 n=1 Tax=Portunus trituberculatus TaxID=210409 RepID=A0A5B7IAS6_PORTR|nr:Coiled-coil domain-containing protein 93 [Portunus trituberculatus]